MKRIIFFIVLTHALLGVGASSALDKDKPEKQR
jgi:hypothetical protein